MEDTAFGLSRQSTYAKLSPIDLESMGKRASQEFLCDGVPLNDAVVKVAQSHPSISAHQVKRIAEFANTETFSRLFEKQAGDKNIEFPLADPGEILHDLNDGARPSMAIPMPDDYSMGPVKLSHSVVEDDIELAKVFGINLASPGSEKTVVAEARSVTSGGKSKLASVNRILELNAGDDLTAIDRILMAKSAGEGSDRIEERGEQGTSELEGGQLDQGMFPDQAKEETMDEQEITQKVASMAGLPGAGMEGLQQSAKQVGRFRIPGGKAGLLTAAAGAGALGLAGWATSRKKKPPAAAPGVKQAMGGPESVMMNAQPQQHPEVTHRENMRGMERRVELEKKKQELMAMQAKAVETPGDQGGAPQPGMQPQQPQQQQGQQQMAGMEQQAQGGQPVQGAPAAPPMTGGPGQPKMASALTKQAMNYVKSRRPSASLVLNDLRLATSTDRVKEKIAQKETQYPMADPHRELFQAKQRMEKLSEDARGARDKNAFILKEAEDRFHHQVEQHMRQDGTNLGEVIHALDSSSSDYPQGLVKAAMERVVFHLVGRGMDPVKLQAETIPYEMTKGASARFANHANPIVESFRDFCKVASSQPVLDQAFDKLDAKLDEVNGVVSQVLTHASAS